MTTPTEVPPPVDAVTDDAMVDVPQQPGPTDSVIDHTDNSNNIYNQTNEYPLLEELVKLISLPPSKDDLLKLASDTITSKIQNVLSSPSDAHLNIMVTYLRAAAHQLNALDTLHLNDMPTTNDDVDDCTRTMLPVRRIINFGSTICVLHCLCGAYILFHWLMFNFCCSSLKAICSCISQLSSSSISRNTENQESIITDTGILTSLWHMVEYHNSYAVTTFACEFLQACILCRQYSFAFHRVKQTWPVPKKTPRSSSTRVAPACSVDVVYRYYFLRGIVCMGCCGKTTTIALNNLAIRCFWTCLSIPSENGANTVSSIAIAAYKKMVILQALSPIGILHTTMIHIKNDGRKKGIEEIGSTNDNSSTSVMMPTPSTGMSSAMPAVTIPTTTNPLSTPREMPWDLVRFLAQANPPTAHSFSSSAAAAPQRMNTAEHNMETTTSMTLPQNQYKYPNFGVYVYQQLIQTFIMVDRKKFDKITIEHSDLFRADGNYAYICRLSNALYYRQIYVISRSYASMPIHQLCTEMNSLPIEDVRVLLEKMQNNISWPVKICTISAQDEKATEEVVVFPTDLPRPVMQATGDEGMMGLQQEMMELSQRMQHAKTMYASSPNYKTAMAYYDRQKTTTTSNKATMYPSSTVMEDSIPNYSFQV